MTTPPSTSSSAVPEGLPDLTALARLANEMFSALPGGAPRQPPGLPSPQLPLAVDPPTGTYPGGGAVLGSTPSPANPPSASDVPSSLNDTPVGPAAVLPRSSVPGPEVMPGIGVTPTVARPALGPTFYFLEEIGSRGAPGAPGEAELRAFLPALGLPPGPADTRPLGPTAGYPSSPGIEATPDTNLSRYFIREPEPVGVLAPDPHPAFDLRAVRRDFPILSERVNGKQLIWFDNAATTQKPRAVIDRLSHFYEHENSNIHRAAHELAARATDAYEAARATVARFIGAASAEEIVFVRGTTEAINLVASTWGRKNLHQGDEIVISHLEHHANIVPWQLLAAENGFAIKVIPVDDDGQILMDAYTKLVTDRTKLVSVTQVSNALGTITPTKAIIDIAHRHGALTLIDGAQSIAHMRTDLQDLDADFFVFSGHKVYGPTGIGVLYGKAAILADMPPYQGGGNMIADVTLERSIFQPPPGRFEAGTGNIADAVGLGAALDYVDRLGIENIGQYEHDLLHYATGRMNQVPGLRFIGTAREKASVLSFMLDGYEPTQVSEALSREGIAVRAGHHCAQPILRRFGLEATVRPSLALYNTCGEIDEMVAVLHHLASARP
jgi:cysteine desulfurase / selenocysteine lyase